MKVCLAAPPLESFFMQDALFAAAGEFGQMPWSPSDAERHTRKATTWELKELWAKIANDCLERTGDEGRAIREANAVIARRTEIDQ
jgi:hypothetical protein